jgi:TDG/mug DNA glycosylase family protein
MELLRGFAPVVGAGAHTLILGSMPGIASLDADQYYAFRRNVFWKIMGAMYAAGPELEYSSRLQILTANHIALWDVIASCQRPGSLDSAIAERGMKTNNFNDFFQQHPEISRICFNGGKAAELFTKKVLPGLEQTFEFIKLPSTSPAYAAMRYAEKLQAWSVIK